MTDRLKCPVCGIPTIEDRSGMTEEDALCNLHAEGTEGQDRKSYTDTQDRDSYTVDEDEA